MDSSVSLPSPTSFPQGAWSTRLANTAKYASWFVAVLAVTAFAGWTMGIPTLTSLGPGLPPMTFSSILKLLLIAFALRRLEGADDRRNRYAIFFLAFAIATISVLTLMLQLETWTGFDNRVFQRIPVFDPAPNPVGTATCYVLVALALTLAAVDDARIRGFGRLVAIAAGSVALVAIVGLTFRFVRLSVVIPTVGIALPVALGMLAASVSLIVSRPSTRLLRLLEHDSPGAVIFRRLLPLVVAVPLLAGWVQALGLRLGWFAIGESEGVIAVGMIVGCAALILWTAGKLDEMNVDRSMAELRANTQQQWLEVTLANIGDAVIAVDDEVRVGFLNAAAAQLLGVDIAGAIGRNLRDIVQLVDERTGDAIESPFRKAFHELRPVTLDGEPTVRLADGTLCGIEASATPILAASGGLIGGVLVLRDVSARRARTHAEREAFQALDRRVGERTRALERTMTVLRESTTLLRTIAASTPELIVAKSREGRIMMVNPAAVQAMGLSRAQVLGQKEQELFEDSEELRRMLENDRRVIETRRPIAVEETRRTKAGLRTYLVTKSPLRDSQGQVFGLVGVAKDITDRKRAQRELEDLLVAEHRLRGEAERANRAKDEFLAIVSHELRSPLNALKGWSQVLLSVGKPDPALVGRAAEAIKRNIDHQTRLIDDLLDTSRIISGKLELDNRPVDLVEVVRAALELLRDSAAGKGVELEFAAECATAVVNGDSDRLQQIVINLVSNAIKFTLEGGKIQIRLERPDELVRLSVSDNGVGIDADFLPHVFDRFSQADTSVTRRYLGLGIGLALVRNLVELHGGTVRAESAGSGAGSLFTVEFPSSHVEAEDRPDLERGDANAKPAVPRGLDGVHALLVDDDPDAREVMRLILTQAGASVREFDSGEQVAAAMRMLHEVGDTPDVLLLDIAMPTESGFDVLKRLRGDAALPVVPAVAVTALAHLDRGRFALEGFQGCVGKPVDAHLLVDTIRSILEGAEHERTAAAPCA